MEHTDCHVFGAAHTFTYILQTSYIGRHSFNEALEYRNLITKVRVTEDVPVILVGNKVIIVVATTILIVIFNIRTISTSWSSP